MKNVMLALTLMVFGSSAYAGDCVDGYCSLRSKVVNVTKEVVSVPVNVTRRTVQATRNVGRRTVARVRNIVR